MVNFKILDTKLMNKKIILVLVILLGGCLLLCACCVGVLALGVGKVSEERGEVESGIILTLCEKRLSFDKDIYADYFDENSIDYASAGEGIDRAFGDSAGCSKFSNGNILDSFRSGIEFQLSNYSGTVIARYSFDNADGERVTIVLEKQDSEWKVVEIQAAESY